MKFYIATRLERAADHNAVRDAMVAAGHEITYDWTSHGSVWREGAEVIRDVAERELRGVLDADVVIVLLPGGRGTHVELGIAIAAGKPVVLHAQAPVPTFGASPETCAFYHHPLCWHAIGTAADLVDLVAAVRASTAAPADPAPALEGFRRDESTSCSDGGACHHGCELACFRVRTCEPLSNVYPGDAWPDYALWVNGVHRE